MLSFFSKRNKQKLIIVIQYSSYNVKEKYTYLLTIISSNIE
jgi:hypothetical protein